MFFTWLLKFQISLQNAVERSAGTLNLTEVTRASGTLRLLASDSSLNLRFSLSGDASDSVRAQETVVDLDFDVATTDTFEVTEYLARFTQIYTFSVLLSPSSETNSRLAVQ